MELKKIEGAIEAILFAMGDAVSLRDIAKTIGHDMETTKKIKIGRASCRERV